MPETTGNLQPNEANAGPPADSGREAHIKKMLKKPISIPGEYLFNQVSSSAIVFWLRLNLLSNPAGKSWWTLEEMAERFSCSVESIKRYIKELEKAGLLKREKMNSGRTVYVLLWPPGCTDPRITSEERKKRSRAQEQMNIDKNDNRYRRRSNSGGFSRAFSENEFDRSGE